LGEVYIYEMTGRNQIKLIDMLILGQPCIIRNVKKVESGMFAVTTENGDLWFFKHNPEAAT
jgi:hypothetical protein